MSKLKWFFIYLLIIIITFIYCYFQPYVSPRMIDKPRDISIATVSETRIINAVILGDSISVSQGASNPLVTGWNIYLKDELEKKYNVNINWINKGLSGTTVDYCLEKSVEITNDIDIVFICVGRNDRNIYTPKQFNEKYSLLISNIKEKAPKANIFCIIEPPMVSLDDSLFDNIRQVILNVSEKTNVYCIDVWSVFPKNNLELNKLLIDGLHPNDQGYVIMSEYIKKCINLSAKSSNLFYYYSLQV